MSDTDSNISQKAPEGRGCYARKAFCACGLQLKLTPLGFLNCPDCEIPAGPGTPPGRDPEPMPQDLRTTDAHGPEDGRDPILRVLEQIRENAATSLEIESQKLLALRRAAWDAIRTMRIESGNYGEVGSRRILGVRADALESALAAVEGRS